MNRVLVFFYDSVLWVVGPVNSKDEIEDKFEEIVGVRPNHVLVNFSKDNNFVRASFDEISLEARAYPLNGNCYGLPMDDDEGEG